MRRALTKASVEELEQALSIKRARAKDKEQWKSKPFTRNDKRIHITGPGDINMFVDYDDVNQPNINRVVSLMLKCLNKHFEADYGQTVFEPNTGKIHWTRHLVEDFIRECYKVKPPSLKEHKGRSLDALVSDAVDEIMQNPNDVRAIEIIMLKLDTNELPGKVAAWRKVLRGDC